MKLSTLPRKVARGLPYLGKEVRAMVSDSTPLFIGLPRVVHIWRSAPCNAKCIMCDYGWLKGEALRKYITSQLTDDMITNVIPQIAELSGRGTMVSYMGGEATICKSLVDWVKLCSSKGLDFRFTTNGYMMNEEMASRLVDAGLFNIGVSIESLDPVINETIRPFKDGTAKTLRAVDLLLQERERQRKHVSLNIKTVLTDINLESFLDIVKRFGKIDGIMCTPQLFELMDEMPQETRQKLYVKDINRLERVLNQILELKAQGYNIHVTEDGLKEMLKSHRDNKDMTATMHTKNLQMESGAPTCNIGTDNMWIHNGEVKLCPYHPPIGNIISDKLSLKEMWESDQAKKVRNGTRACRRLCTISCLRRTPLRHKVGTFMKLA